MTVNTILNDFARAFEKKINKEYSISVQLEIKDTQDEIYQIDVKNGKVDIYDEERIKPEDTIMVIRKEILNKIYNNELSVLSAFLQTPSRNDVKKRKI